MTLQICFAEKLCQFVVRNFFLRTSSYAQIIFPVQSSFQSSFKRKIQWLQMKRRVRGNSDHIYSIILAVITNSEGNMVCTNFQYNNCIIVR